MTMFGKCVFNYFIKFLNRMIYSYDNTDKIFLFSTYNSYLEKLTCILFCKKTKSLEKQLQNYIYYNNKKLNILKIKLYENIVETFLNPIQLYNILHYK